jgi:epsilon-lactone hydrolase
VSDELSCDAQHLQHRSTSVAAADSASRATQHTPLAQETVQNSSATIVKMLTKRCTTDLSFVIRPPIMRQRHSRDKSHLEPDSDRRLEMQKLSEMILLLCVLTASAHAVDDHVPQHEPAQEFSQAIPEVDAADVAPRQVPSEGIPQSVSREGAEYLEKLRKGTPFGTVDFSLEALRMGMGVRNEPHIEGVRLIRAIVGDIPCEWVLAPGADPDLRLLYLHGGGWVSGSGGNYLPLAADISVAARCAVLLPDYRLAPEHRFPAGLEDCIAADDWLVANGPSGPASAKATFIAGDSAGGNLTLATLLALRDRKRPLPAGGIALSAATDFTLASESLKTVHDPIISARTMPEFRDRYLEKTDPCNPLASPVFGDYRGIPPLLIQVGEHEMLRDDSVRVAEKAVADGISVKLEVWPGMVHVFQIRGLPESREAIRHIAEFMRSRLPSSR